MAAEDPALTEVTVWNLNTASDLMAIAAEVLAGELAAALGDFDTAILHLDTAVRLQDALIYDEPPPWYFPVRQSLGAVLLEAGRPREAEQVFVEDLAGFPENGCSLFGLAQSLADQGESEAASEALTRFEAAWRSADVKLTSPGF